MCVVWLSVCADSPPGWTDSEGDGCQDYKDGEYCTAAGQAGLGWDPAWGTLSQYANDGKDATEACCACGGGAGLFSRPLPRLLIPRPSPILLKGRAFSLHKSMNAIEEQVSQNTWHWAPVSLHWSQLAIKEHFSLILTPRTKVQATKGEPWPVTTWCVLRSIGIHGSAEQASLGIWAICPPIQGYEVCHGQRPALAGQAQCFCLH